MLHIQKRKKFKYFNWLKALSRVEITKKRIIYHDLGVCVHCGNCAETFPFHWTLKGEFIEETIEDGLTPIKDLTHICPLGAYKEKKDS